MPNLYVEIVAPDRNVFRGEASAIRMPGTEGSFQVLPNHAPLLGVLGVGPMFVDTAAGERVAFATAGGFVQVLNNRVIVLAESAEPVSEIDVERARAAEERARERLQSTSGGDREAAERDLERARNRLRTAMASV